MYYRFQEAMISIRGQTTSFMVMQDSYCSCNMTRNAYITRHDQIASIFWYSIFHVRMEKKNRENNQKPIPKIYFGKMFFA